MKSREKFEMRTLLTMWNVCLAVFSTMGACRMVPELIHALTTAGFRFSVCNPSFIQNDSVSGVWTFMFVLSKVPELIDTVFIVLRKQPLIFLHW